MQRLQVSSKVTGGDPSSLKIAGFGACMIAGYPHDSGGLFEVACRFVEKSLSRCVQSHLTSLDGFSAPRAEKWLKKRVFDFNPDYVVIQFGATDASCPLRRKRNPSNLSSDANAGLRKSAYHAPTAFTVARWEIVSLASFLLKAEAVTPLSSYLDAIGRMAESCRSEGITPIILSPFVFGSRYSTRNAVLYTNSLRELRSRTQPFIFLDCVRLLSKFPRSEIVLNDGFHLSSFAHNIIGEAIGEVIVADFVGAVTRGASVRMPQKFRALPEKMEAGSRR